MPCCSMPRLVPIRCYRKAIRASMAAALHVPFAAADGPGSGRAADRAGR